MAERIDGHTIHRLTDAEGREIGRIKEAVRDEILRRDFQISREEIEELVRSLA